jgi:hypothetical protein
MANKTRKASDSFVRKVWAAKAGVEDRLGAVAKRIGYSRVGTARFLYRLGLLNTKTAKSR